MLALSWAPRLLGHKGHRGQAPHPVLGKILKTPHSFMPARALNRNPAPIYPAIKAGILSPPRLFQLPKTKIKQDPTVKGNLQCRTAAKTG